MNLQSLVLAALATLLSRPGAVGVCTPNRTGEFAFGGCLPDWTPTYNMAQSTIIMVRVRRRASSLRRPHHGLPTCVQGSRAR